MIVTSSHARWSPSVSEMAVAIRIATISRTIAQNSVVSGAHFVSSCIPVTRSPTCSTRLPGSVAITLLLPLRVCVDGPAIATRRAVIPSNTIDPLYRVPSRLMVSGFERREDGIRPRFARRHRCREHVQVHSSVPRFATEALESIVDLHVESLGEHPFRLLDDDPGGEGGSQLIVLPPQRLMELGRFGLLLRRSQMADAHAGRPPGSSFTSRIARKRSKPVA